MKKADPTRPSGSEAAARRMGFALLFLLASCSDGPLSSGLLSGRSQAESELLHRILIAEDQRVSTPLEMAPLDEGVVAANAQVRRIAVRALGRMERVALVPQIASLLEDPEPTVRAEAANALAQAVIRGDPATEVAPARARLLGRLAAESDPDVRGAIVQSAGRTRHASGADIIATAAAIARASSPQRPVARDPAVGVRFAKGLYLLARQPAGRGVLPDSTLTLLRELARAAGTDAERELAARRTRTLAVAALSASGAVNGEDLQAALADQDPLVRREAIVAAASFADSTERRALLDRGLVDRSGVVRYDALRGLARVARDAGCEASLAAARDEDTHVALLAIDQLTGCSAQAGAADLLDSLALGMTGTAPVSDWHRAAHALVALATLDRSRATERLLPFVANRNPFVRVYAARAAATVREATTLTLLTRDSVPNVRTAALEGLAELEGRDVDPILIQNLGQEDPQLLITAAGLLSGTADPAALPALLSALERVTARRRETERDARMAILERIQELGSAGIEQSLRPLLHDYDPVVAARAADLLGEWTGTRPASTPQRLTPAPMPTPAELDRLDGRLFTVEMADGGTFELRVRAWDAPSNALRFARLAEGGFFDGLTYHRVAPNFVVQGGSPNANEYSGNGPFTRDELGQDGNWRGTVGLSTRGRDTGDGQMYFNLIDNVRLDHEYTVWADVVRGMEVVDALQEGAQIRRITRAEGG